jgi:hypothetical protein
MPGPVAEYIKKQAAKEKLVSQPGYSFDRWGLSAWSLLTTESGEDGFGTEGSARRLIKDMLKDDAVKAAFLTKIFSVSSLTWQVQPEDKQDPRDRLVAEFNKFNLEQMEGGTRAVVEEILIPGLIDKYVVAEIVERPEPLSRGKWVGKSVWAKLKAKEDAEVKEDKFGNIIAVEGRNEDGERKEFDPSGFVIFKYLPLYNRPISDFRAAVRWVKIKNVISKLWAVGLERFGLPFFHGKYPTGETGLRDQLETALETLKARNYFVTPDGVTVDPVTAVTSGHADYQAAIERCDKGIFVSINGAFLQSITSQTTDDRGNSQVQKGTAELFVWHLAECMKDTANEQIIPRVTDKNFTDANYPKASLGSVNDQELLNSARLDELLVKNGLPLSKKDRYDYYGRAMPSGPDDEMKLPAATGAGPPAFPFSAPPREFSTKADKIEKKLEDQTADEGEVALAGSDGAQAEKLLKAAKDEGTKKLSELAEAAVGRLVDAGPGALRFKQLFTHEELADLADQIAATNATAELLGRARIRKRQEQAEKNAGSVARFSEQPTDLRVFDERGGLTPLPPRAALDYFKKLVPGITVDAARFGPLMERQAFTLAVTTDQTLLNSVQDIIRGRLASGEAFKKAEREIQALLEAAGVAPANPQYSEMVFRTNMRDAYQTGAQRELAQVKETFPVWMYAAVGGPGGDGRNRPSHLAKHGKYYSSSVPFTVVRGTNAEDVCNDRCDSIPVDRWEWEELVKAGARVEAA